MLLWPRFSSSRTALGNRVEVKDMFTLRAALSIEFKGGSCCGSQIVWGSHICRVLLRCKIAHSRTPISVCVTIWVRVLEMEGWGAGTWKRSCQVRLGDGGLRNWERPQGSQGIMLNYVNLHWMILNDIEWREIALSYMKLLWITLKYVNLRWTNWNLT